MKGRVIEAQFMSKQKPPKECSYCMEEKSFLMLKPHAYVENGEVLLNVNHTNDPLWICLECFSSDVEMMDVNVSIDVWGDE